MTKEIFGIKTEREKAGLTLEQLSEKSKIELNYLSQIESGISFPTVRDLTDIAWSLGLKEGHFLKKMIYGK
jgi:transcriptional regulator with XRE-family HTH domain